MAVRYAAAAHTHSSTSGLSVTDYTMLCWVQLVVDRNAFGAVLRYEGTSRHAIEIASDGVTVRGKVGSTVFGATALTLGNWYRVAQTFDGTTGRFYLGAEGAALTETSTTAIAALGTVTGFFIGKQSGATEYINGRVAGVKVWHSVLSTDEVTHELGQYVPRRGIDLARFHPFIVTETADYSGNGYTLSGGTDSTTEDGPPIPWDVLHYQTSQYSSFY